MESGASKSDIKIKSGSLFAKGKKHGYVCNSVYCSVNPCPSVATMDTFSVSNSNGLKNDLHLCLYNCRSLTNKLIDFHNFVYSSNYNFTGLTETWLEGNMLDNEILPKGYTIYLHRRCTRGGGVLIAVEGSVSSQLIDCPKELELLLMQIGFEHPTRICLVYNPPNNCVEYK